MRILHRRLSALVMSLGLVAGNAGACAGWTATPQARMACCSERAGCPTHAGESDDAGSDRAVSQAEADNCCASSERETSNPSTPTFVAAIPLAIPGPAVLLPPSVPALVLSDGWRTIAPVPATPVRKHVLLSVFLV